MRKIAKDFYLAAVSTAILNKYANVPQSQIAEAVSIAIRDIDGATEAQLIARLQPVRGFLDDINNQAIVLALIERFWSDPPKLDRPLTTLNASSFGNTTPVFRSTDYVADLDGDVLTSKTEVVPRLDELERFCRHVIPNMSISPIDEKVLILAHIFGSLIRIHPFVDGNGRTARLFAFYALRCWGLPLFPIPKVRNDPDWKAAIEAAVAGDPLKLKNQFLSRVEKEINSIHDRGDG